MSTKDGAIDKKSISWFIKDILLSTTEYIYANEAFDINKIVFII